MEEQWRDISGYEGLYQVSNLGQVKSMDYRHTGKEKVISSQTQKNGYLHVSLWKDRTKRFFYIHRLVADAFIPNPDNLPEVNHKDECLSNNSVDNLEWCTSIYNANYGTRNSRMSNSKKSVKCEDFKISGNR